MPAPDRILILAPRWVGESLMATPMLRLLRERRPSAHITVLARGASAAVFHGSPDVDEIWEHRAYLSTAARIRRTGFVEGYAILNSFRAALLLRLGGVRRRFGYASEGRGFLLTDPLPWRGDVEHRAVRFARLVDPDLTSLSRSRHPCTIPIGPEAESEADRLLKGRDPQRLVALNPCSMNATSRRWAAPRFGALAVELDREGFGIALVGGPSIEDRERVDAVLNVCKGVDVLDLCGETTLGGLAAVLARLPLLVTGDVGLMHLGSASGVPMLVLAGASNTDLTGPWTTREYHVLREPVPCAPCVRNECRNRETPMICMESIEMDRVLRAALQTLNRPVPA